MRGADGYRIEPVCDQLLDTAHSESNAVVDGKLSSAIEIGVAASDHLDAVDQLQGSGVIARDPSASDDADTQCHQ